MGHIINSVCLCLCMCLSVCLHSHCHISWSIFAKSDNEVTTPKVQKYRINEFVWGQHHTTPSPIYLQNHHFWPKGPENPSKHKYANFCLKCSQTAEIPASCRKSGSRNKMVTSDFRPEVETSQVHACIVKICSTTWIYAKSLKEVKGPTTSKSCCYITLPCDAS